MRALAPIGLRLSLVGAALLQCNASAAELFGEARPLHQQWAEPVERQITSKRGGHLLTNIGVWSPDSRSIVYDTRSTPAGDRFDGSRIELVQVPTGKVQVLYHSSHGAHCGVVTFHPRQNKVVFILGPEHPTADWQYCAWHRQGAIVECARPGRMQHLDARDVSAPYTPGALRGGSHVHVWDPSGEWVSFTYEDAVLAGLSNETPGHDVNQRNIGVSAPFQSVTVAKDHPRNCDGTFFSVLVTRTVARPQPGSDQIDRACEEGWIGSEGYLRSDGTRQRHALAFQGRVLSPQGQSVSEVFVVDLPEDLRIAGEGPLAGTPTRMPFPPRGTVQRRLTFTSERKHAGLQGPRHWLRSSPDGSQIAFLMKDDGGVVQLCTVSPQGGPISQLTHNHESIASAFSWSPDGQWIAHVMDNSVCVTDAATGKTRRLTQRSDDASAPRPEACVFSPDGMQIAYVRPVWMKNVWFNQIFIVSAGN